MPKGITFIYTKDKDEEREIYNVRVHITTKDSYGSNFCGHLKLTHQEFFLFKSVIEMGTIGANTVTDCVSRFLDAGEITDENG